jgi:hypothetical protein
MWLEWHKLHVGLVGFVNLGTAARERHGLSRFCFELRLQRKATQENLCVPLILQQLAAGPA